MWCQYISVIVLNNKFYGKCFKKACAVQFWRPFHKSRRDVRQLLTQSDSLPLDNCSLFNVLCDIAEDTSPLNLGTSCRWSRKKVAPSRSCVIAVSSFSVHLLIDFLLYQVCTHMMIPPSDQSLSLRCTALQTQCQVSHHNALVVRGLPGFLQAVYR